MKVLYRSPFGGVILRDGDELVTMSDTDWRTSSHSGGTNCVETAWVKSSYSGMHDCVETRPEFDGMLMRDSKDKTGPVLLFGLESWRAFIADVKTGAFNGS